MSRVVRQLRDPEYRGSYALLANTAGTSIIGALYWAVAARLFGPQDLGRATSLISALTLVATLTQLNLSNTLMRFIPQMSAKTAKQLINLGYLASAVAAVIGSVIFVTVLPKFSSEWDFISNSVFFAVIFSISVIAWQVFSLQDAALVGLQRAAAVPIENVIYALMKLALLVIGVKVLASTDILFSWVLPLIVLIPAMNWLIFHRILRDRTVKDMVPGGMRFRYLARFASVDYGGLIASQISANALPLLVISVLGPTAAGSFYIASLITSGVASLGISFSTGLLVEASAAPHRLPELTRGALKRCVLIMVPMTLALVFGARLILKIYGDGYVGQTARLFQLLALALLPFCIETIAFSLDRIAGKPIRATLSQAAIAILTLGGSWVLFHRFGLNGVGIAVFGGDAIVAIVRLPTVLNALRRRPAAAAAPAAGRPGGAGSAGAGPAGAPRPGGQARPVTAFRPTGAARQAWPANASRQAGPFSSASRQSWPAGAAAAAVGSNGLAEAARSAAAAQAAAAQAAAAAGSALTRPQRVSPGPRHQPPAADPRHQPASADAGHRPNGTDPRYQPPGADLRHQPNGTDPRYQPPATEPRHQPNGAEPRQPNGTDPRYQPPGGEWWRQPNGADPRYQPPGPDPRHQANGTDPRYQPPATEPRHRPNGTDPRYQPPNNEWWLQPNGAAPRQAPGGTEPRRASGTNPRRQPNGTDPRYQPGADPRRPPNGTDPHNQPTRTDLRRLPDNGGPYQPQNGADPGEPDGTDRRHQPDGRGYSGRHRPREHGEDS